MRTAPSSRSTGRSSATSSEPRGGTEIDTQGDAFFYAFPRAREAVAAAVEVQRAHAGRDLAGTTSSVRVRIGLHTGEPAVGEEGYHGLDVVRAARICTAARGGNVLMSETTRALTGSSLPEGVSVFPLGERRLKGIDEPERVFELDIEGVEPSADVPDEPAPAKSRHPRKGRDKEFERQFEDFGQRLSESIQARVLRSLDRTLGKVAGAPRPRTTMRWTSSRIDRSTNGSAHGSRRPSRRRRGPSEGD